MSCACTCACTCTCACAMWRCCTPAVNNKHPWATQARDCRPSFLRGPRARRHGSATAAFTSHRLPPPLPFWPWRVLCPGPCATAPSHPRFPSLTDRVAMLPVSCRRWWWPWPCFASVVRGSLVGRFHLYGQTRALPLSSTTCVRPERHRAQSCVIALRSPAPERSSEYFQIFTRYSPQASAPDTTAAAETLGGGVGPGERPSVVRWFRAALLPVLTQPL